MAKMTETQAVEAIRRLTAEEEIKAVLMNCAKTVIVEVGEELTGDRYTNSEKCYKKEYIAELAAGRIAHVFKQNAFLSLTVKEQVAELVKADSKEVGGMLYFCDSEQDINGIAFALGLNIKDYDSWYETARAIAEKIHAIKSKEARTDYEELCGD